MKSILLLGAGRSAYVLISYLTEQVAQFGWHLTIADSHIEHVKERNLPDNVQVLAIQVQDAEQVKAHIKKADLVISMLPATFHPLIAGYCLELKRNLLTASYVSPEIKAMDAVVKEAGLTFMMEAGLDPGIDHMSAMAIIQKIKNEGGQIQTFKSYTGGLISPESDNNPWHYKFTWNPRNVVLAGQGTAKYLEDGQYKYIPYQQLFNRTEIVHLPTLGELEGYANRDSLGYQQPYDLPEIKTLIRGTLRRKGYCEAWHLLVQLGLTDDSYILPNSSELTYRQFIQSFLPAPYHPKQTWYEQVAEYLQLAPDSAALARIKWLAFPDELIELPQATPAQILEKLLSQKWALEPNDKDMVVMQHIFEYTRYNEKRRLISSLVVIGEDAHQTAMAKTVGLPVGILAKQLLQNKIPHSGVIIPTLATIYEPVLKELVQYNISFLEEETVLA